MPGPPQAQGVSTPRRVLFVSKAVEPPWNDSSKNLVRDISSHLTRFAGTTMVRSGGEGLPVYGGKAPRFAPGLASNGRVFGALLADRDHPLWHFFFAPNPRSGIAGHAIRALKRRRCVHTVCSAPRSFEHWKRSLFADRVVVLSRHTEQALLSAGYPPEKLRRISPALKAPSPLDASERLAARRHFGLSKNAALVTYAGDLEFGGGAELMLAACRGLDVQLVMACRPKTAAAADVERRLRALGGAQWVGETDQIHALLGCSDVVALPGASLYAKMDYPLVLLEAMAMERPVVVGESTPARELVRGGAFVAAADQESTRSAIESALLASGQGALGRAYVLDEFGPARVAAEYEALYEELLL